MEKKFYKTINKRIEDAIKQSGEKQNEIAKKMEVSNAYISAIKKDKKISLYQFYKLCIILDLSADDMLDIR